MSFQKVKDAIEGIFSLGFIVISMLFWGTLSGALFVFVVLMIWSDWPGWAYWCVFAAPIVLCMIKIVIDIAAEKEAKDVET